MYIYENILHKSCLLDLEFILSKITADIMWFVIVTIMFMY